MYLFFPERIKPGPLGPDSKPIRKHSSERGFDLEYNQKEHRSRNNQRSTEEVQVKFLFLIDVK